MIQTVEAIFEHGVFRVLNVSDLPLSEGQQVRLIIETHTENSADLLDLAARVYEGLSSRDINEIERIALERRVFFEEEKRG